MRVETNCGGCVAAVLVLTLEPREAQGKVPAESIDRCRARMTRAAGWDFDLAGQPRCPDCRAKAHAATNLAPDPEPAPAKKPAPKKARKR